MSLLLRTFAVDAFAAPVAPYFTVSGPDYVITEVTADNPLVNKTWQIHVRGNERTITAAQGVLTFNASQLAFVQVSTINSACSFWAPADPSLGFGNGSTPYVTGGNKIVLSCGFSNPGLATQLTGNLLVNFTLKPYSPGTSSFTFSNTQFRYIGSVVTPGYSPPFNLEVSGSTISPTPTPSPTPRPSVTPTPIPSLAPSPTPTPTPTPTPVASSSSAVATPEPDTLKASDLNLVDITKKSGSQQTQTGTSGVSGQDLDVVEQDNLIPPPPDDMPLRAKATPFVNRSSTDSASILPEGEVLSLQSLRELLIPGKSAADKTLVLFNLISTLTFLTLLAVLVWRMIVSSRTNQLKYRHMNELIEGELAVLESKLEGVRGNGGSEAIERSLDDLKKELDTKQ